MANAIVITTDGTATLHNITTLADFQTHVDGWVEALGADDGDHTLWLNEEGKILGLPLNTTADALAHELVAALPADDQIVGPMIITGPLADDGETYQPPAPHLLARFNLT